MTIRKLKFIILIMTQNDLHLGRPVKKKSQKITTLLIWNLLFSKWLSFWRGFKKIKLSNLKEHKTSKIIIPKTTCIWRNCIKKKKLPKIKENDCFQFEIYFFFKVIQNDLHFDEGSKKKKKNYRAYLQDYKSRQMTILKLKFIT